MITALLSFLRKLWTMPQISTAESMRTHREDCRKTAGRDSSLCASTRQSEPGSFCIVPLIHALSHIVEVIIPILVKWTLMLTFAKQFT